MITAFFIDSHVQSAKRPYTAVNCYNAHMNRNTIDTLNRLNASFYRENSESFDRTRQTAWPGWERVVEQLVRDDVDDQSRILDVACGNMRFERFLLETAPGMEFHAVCVDSCDELAVPVHGCEFLSCDIVHELMSGGTLIESWGLGYDAVVSFGFFHHVPSANLRIRLLDALVDATAPDGFIAISLWRFAEDSKMREKAERATVEALAALPLVDELEEGDYLLGWNDVSGTYRYCHSFNDSEIEHLVEHAKGRARLVDRFRADGRSGDSNEYLVFRR